MPQKLGVLIDPREQTQKEFDYKHEEIFTSSVPNYLTEGEAQKYVGVFPTDDQHGTSSCVAHGKTLVTSIFKAQQGNPFTQLSSMFIYRNRSNFPGEGMVPSLANMQVIKQGAPIFADLPTPQTEAEANALVINSAMILAAKANVAGKWVTLMDPTDIDTMAFVSNSLQLPLNIIIYATIAEWDQAVVEILTPGLTQGNPLAVVEHCITILPNSGYIAANGKRYVIIQDSAFFGGLKFRAVSEDFIAARVTESDYMIALGSAPIARPKVNLTVNLTVGATGPDVMALQTVLQYMGYLPNVVNGAPFAPTGFYGGMTKNAVLALQNAYPSETLTPAGLTVGTGYCGSLTRGLINSLFA